MCPAGDVDGDLCSAQFCESLGIQNQEEGTLRLHMGPEMANVTDALHLIIIASGVTQLWLILQGGTCLSGRDDD